MLAFGHFERRLGRVEIGAGREAALDERLHAIAGEARLLQHGAPLPHEAGVLDVDVVFVARGRQSEPHAGLLQRGLGLLQAQLEVGRHQPREDLPLLHRASEVDLDLVDPARDLEGERHLILGGERAGDGDHPFEGLFAHEHAGNLPGCIGVSGPGRNRPGRARAPRQQGQYDSDGFYSQDWSPHSGAIVTQNLDFTQLAEGPASPRRRRGYKEITRTRGDAFTGN